MSTYSDNLKIEEIGTGEQAGTWGVTTNDNFVNVFEQAIVGRVTVAFSNADVTLTATNSVSSQSFRNVYLNCTGTNAASRNLIVPTINKNYVVQNNTTGGFDIVVKTTAGTGITVPNGRTCTVYADGTNVIQAFDYLPSLNVPTLNITTLDATNIEVTNIKAKDGTASATIADSTGIMTIASSVLTTTDINGGTIDGTTIGASTASTGLFTTVGVSGVATFSAGSASTPAITTTGDTNTGIFFPAADTIAFTEGGVEAMRIDSTGRAIVGATSSTLTFSSAQSRLQVVGTDFQTASASIICNAASDQTFGLYFAQTGATILSNYTLGIVNFGAGTNSSARISSVADGNHGAGSTPGNLRFFTTPSGSTSITERMRIDSSGNVGIGTTTPAARLNVTGTFATNNNIVSIISSGLAGSATGDVRGLYVNTQAVNSATNIFGVFSEITYTNSQTNYGGYFSAREATGTSYGVFGLGTQSDTNGPGTAYGGYFRAASGGTGTAGQTYGTRIENTAATGSAAYGLTVSTVAGATTVVPFQVIHAGTELMRIASSGNLLIGTTSSSGTAARLVVNGGIAALGSSTFAGAGGYTFLGGSGDTDGGMFSPADGTLTFATNNSEKVRITPLGDVGIGTTSPTAKLDVIGQIRTNDQFISNGGSRDLRMNDNFGGSIAAVGVVSSNPLMFFTTNTERMRIAANGNVGIGTNGPGANLEVFSASDVVTRIHKSGVAQWNIGVASNPYAYVDSSVMAFGTGSAESMRISSGNLLVGTTSSYTNSKLTVNGGVNATRFNSYYFTETRTGSTTFYFYGNASQSQGNFNYASFGTGDVLELSISVTGAANEAGCVWTGWTDGDQAWRTMSSYSQGELGSFTFSTGVTSSSGWVAITWNPYAPANSCNFFISIRRINRQSN
jgi:hypothetical protein